MTYEISRREVLNNLIRFKDNLLDLREDFDQRRKAPEPDQQRVYRALLNRRTGDMRFAQKLSHLERHLPKQNRDNSALEDWRAIKILVQPDLKSVCFELLDANNAPLKEAEFEPMAWKIACETIDVLNKKSKAIEEIEEPLLLEEQVLRDLSDIHFSLNPGRIEDLPGWVGNVGRVEAEQLLQGQAVGTYLIRNGDEMTIAITFHLEEENHVALQPYLLTVVDKKKKVDDFLLLKTNKGWLHYLDNPDLKDREYKVYSTPQALIASFSEKAKIPFKFQYGNK